MRIRTRILCTLLGMALLVGLVGALAVNRQRASVTVAAIKEAENVARVLGFVLMSDPNQLHASAQEIVTRLHEAQGRDVVLVDAHRRILADAMPATPGEFFSEDQRGEVIATIRDGKVRTFVETSKDHPSGIKQIVAPVKSKSGQILGAVVLEYTPLYEELMQSTRNTIREVALAGFGSVAIAFLIAFYVGRSIARPLQQLTNAATGFASGRIDLPVPPLGKNEIAELATAFNHMVQKRQAARDELRRMRDELEVRVVERTAELEKTNEALQAENTERKRAEETLRESEGKFRQLAENIADVFWITSPDMQQTHYVSPAYEQIWGRSAASLYENPQEWAEAILPADRDRVWASFSKLAADEPSVSTEFRIARPDGEVRWILSRGFQVRNAAGEVIRITGVATDITERKKNEVALQRSEAHTKAIVQSSLDCIVTIDHEGKILEFNPAAEMVFGHPRAKVMGMELAEVIIPPSLRERHRQGMTRYLATGEAKVLGKRIEMAAIRSDGSEFPVELAITRLGAEEPPMFTGFIRDITERKRAEEALRQAEEKYRDIFENAVEGIFQTTPEGSFIAANFALARMLGFDSAEELIAARTDIAQENYVDPKSREEFKRLLDKNGSVLDFELEVYRKDRSKIWFSENVRAVRDEKGTVVYYEGTAEDVTKRKRAEDALRASEERYRSLFESNPNPMWVYDIETLSFLAVNAAAVEHYGYSQEEFLAMTIKDIRPAEDIPALMDDLAKQAGGAKGSTAWRHCRKNRTMIYVELASRDLIWLGRRARLSLINDVTERKQAEKHLAQMEGRYRGLLEAAPDAMVVVNQGGEIVLLNLQAEKQFGYRRDELVGQKVKNIIPEGFAERLVADDLRSAEDALAQQIGTGIELTGRRKNGSDFPIEIMLSPLESADGILVTAAIRDITERKQAEQKLLEQADLLNLAQDAIMVRGMDDRIAFWNRGAEHLYGWSAEEVLDQPSSDFLAYEEPLKILAERTLLETGAWSGECGHLTKQGKTVIVRSHWTLVRDEQGEPKAKLIIMTDVTEQKKLETHLLRAQRLESIGTLASGVAHDLNNILTPILMCAEVLRQDPDAEDAALSIALIEESAKRGANVVKQVLTFARGIEGERVVIKPTHLIQEMIDIAQKTFPKTIEIIGRYPDDLWSIKCDPTQLHQVLLNLSVNARDAMPNGGSLTLGAENFTVDENYAAMTPDAMVGSYIVLRVSDSGVGMPRATVDKIFDPFFTTKEVGKGTGLGLSTALGIVKSHNGFISVDSELGKGTTFKIFLPATMSDVELEKSKTVGAPIEGNGEQILIVDDEPNILEITKMIFEKHNYRVISANDGTEALALFAQQMDSIGGVLTDIAMPYMNGVALVRALRRMKADIPIVASTGQGDQPGVAELRSLGVTSFLTKPYNTEKLLMTVHDTLQGRKSVS